ncbi:hypothetical protein NQZ68_028530 [Dissostichus eleginoides]|nr:hypothetical protein NQZ68_028530 [Dissostichus eleginoides]
MKGGSKTVNKQIVVLVTGSEPRLSEGQNTAVPEILMKPNIILKLVNLVPQRLNVPQDHRGQRNPREPLPSQA